MADARFIEVVITEQKKNVDAKPKGEENKATEKEDNLFKSVIVNQAWQYAKQDIEKVAHYEIDKYFSLNDDYIGQRTVTAAVNVIKRTAQAVTGVVAAGIAGSKFGPVGTAIAAAVAVVGESVNIGLDIFQNFDAERIKIRQMDKQLGYQRQRVGYSLTSGSIGDNR